MANILDKILDVMKVDGDEDDYYDEDDFEEEPAAPKIKKLPVKTEDSAEEEDDSRSPIRKAVPKLTPYNNRAAKNGGNSMKVCVIKPTSIDDAREITETLLANRTVVLNLEGLDVDIAQRIIDFTSGSCFALSGNLQKISHYIFIVTPSVVDLSGDFQEILSGSFDLPINNGL